MGKKAKALRKLFRKLEKKARAEAGLDLDPVDPKWTGLMLVCRKCMSKLPDGSPGRELRSAIKKAANDSGYGKRLRVAESGCLDICPKNGVTVCHVGRLRPAPTLAVLRPPFDARSVLRWVLEGDRPSPMRDETMDD